MKWPREKFRSARLNRDHDQSLIEGTPRVCDLTLGAKPSSWCYDTAVESALARHRARRVADGKPRQR